MNEIHYLRVVKYHTFVFFKFQNIVGISDSSSPEEKGVREKVFPLAPLVNEKTNINRP